MSAVEHFLPLWVRDPATRRATARKARADALPLARRFARGLPRWAVLYLWHVLVGLARVTRELTLWIADQDSAQLQREHAGRAETDAYVKVQSARRAHLHARFLVAVAVVLVVAGPVALFLAPYVLSAVLGLFLTVLTVKAIPGRGLVEVAVAVAVGAAVWWFGGMLFAAFVMPWWAWWVLYGLAAVAVVMLERYGRPEPAAALEQERLAGGGPPVKLDVIREALIALGVPGMRDPEQIGAVQMPHRHGAGVQVEVQLPAGVEALEVLRRRGRLASALRREEKCVHLSRGKRNAGHLVVYVADEPMTEQDQGRWELDGTTARSLFTASPVGTNVRGEWVRLTLAYANAVIGAMPRQGKTFFLRELALIAAHDLRAKLYTLDGKGTGDFRPLEPVAHFRSMGDEPEEIARVLGMLREVRAEMRRRAGVLAGLSAEECPENKITDALAGRAGFEPLVLVVDETQAYFGYGSKVDKGDKAIRAEFEEIVTDLVKRGPAMAIVVLLATQNVNGETIPRAISTNAVIRFALRLFDESANNLVLGPGAHGRGYSTTDYDAEDKGVGILRGDGAEPETIRTVFGLDGPAVRRIAQRLAALRAAAGRLTGQAAGEDVEPEPVVDLLGDVRDVMDHPPVPTMHLAEMCDALAQLRPHTWGHLDPAGLGSLLRGAGVKPATVWSRAAQKDGRGVRREWLDVDDDGETAEVIDLTGPR